MFGVWAFRVEGLGFRGVWGFGFRGLSLGVLGFGILGHVFSIEAVVYVCAW